MSVINDEWQTTKRSWDDIAHFFSGYKTKTIWMPFYYDGLCAKSVTRLVRARLTPLEPAFT
eukprot:1375407-Amorphochlora_amoeboformis.AAC.1